MLCAPLPASAAEHAPDRADSGTPPQLAAPAPSPQHEPRPGRAGEAAERGSRSVGIQVFTSELQSYRRALATERSALAAVERSLRQQVCARGGGGGARVSIWRRLAR